MYEMRDSGMRTEKGVNYYEWEVIIRSGESS